MNTPFGDNKPRKGRKKGEGRKKERGMATFVAKLVTILDTTDPTIAQWTADGKAFLVHDPKKFGVEVLAKHYKSGNFSSFIRQLNFYSFHKNVKAKDAWEFSHPSFVRGRWDLMRDIKRKTSSEYHVAYDVELGKLRDTLKEVRATVASLRGQLEIATSTIASLRRDKAEAVAIATEANRRLAAAGLSVVDTQSLHDESAVGTSEEGEAHQLRPKKRRRDALPLAEMWPEELPATTVPRMRYTAVRTTPVSTDHVDDNATVTSTDVFSFPSTGLSPLPDDLFDGLLNMDLDDSQDDSSVAMGDLDLSWFQDTGRAEQVFTPSRSISSETLAPALTRSISNLSMGGYSTGATPRALGSLAAEPSLALTPPSGAGAGAGAGAQPPTVAAEVQARVSELSQEEQRQMAVRLFRLLSTGAATTSASATKAQPTKSPSTVVSTRAFAPTASPAPVSAPRVQTPPSSSLEQQVPPQELLRCLLQVPAVSMAVLGTSAVVASAAAAASAAAVAVVDAHTSNSAKVSSSPGMLSPFPVTTA